MAKQQGERLIGKFDGVDTAQQILQVAKWEHDTLHFVVEWKERGNIKPLQSIETSDMVRSKCPRELVEFYKSIIIN